MNREIVLERLNTIKQMPGIDSPQADGPEQDAIYKELDEFLAICVAETPDDYQPTDEDRQATNEMLNNSGRPAIEYVGEGPGVVQATAAVRHALQVEGLPINGTKCQNWKRFVEKYKGALVDV